MNKTIREHLNDLPEPYRTEALNMLSEQSANIIKEKADEALDSAFVWADSPQGFNYWASFHITL
jgi:hypothetical protein